MMELNILRNKIVWLLFLLLTITSVTAGSPTDGSTDTALITFTFSSPIVYDIPFAIDVHSNVNDGLTPFIEFDLAITSDTRQVVFGSPSPELAKPLAVHPLTGKYVGDTGYRYYATATGATLTSAGTLTPGSALFTLQAKIQGGTSPSVILLDPAGQNSITASLGYDALTVSPMASTTITPAFSRCGDGIVGYVDGNNNGIKDVQEVQEACDSALPGGDGCSSDCSYIRASYRIQGTEDLAAQQQCTFGSTSCSLEQLPNLSRFLALMKAIFSSEFPSCFPYVGHPQAEAAFSGERDGAFCVSSRSIFQQIPLLRTALIGYYSPPSMPSSASPSATSSSSTSSSPPPS